MPSSSSLLVKVTADVSQLSDALQATLRICEQHANLTEHFFLRHTDRIRALEEQLQPGFAYEKDRL